MIKFQKPRIYGIDPGNIEDPEAIKNMNELDLFLQIQSLAFKAIDEDELTKEDDYAFNFYLYQTAKFGVSDLPKPSSKRRVPLSPLLISWYDFYKEFVFSLGETNFVSYLNRRQNGDDVSQLLPESSWQESIERSDAKQENGLKIKLTKLIRKSIIN